LLSKYPTVSQYNGQWSFFYGRNEIIAFALPNSGTSQMFSSIMLQTFGNVCPNGTVRGAGGGMSGQRIFDAVLTCKKIIFVRKYFVQNSHNKCHYSPTRGLLDNNNNNNNNNNDIYLLQFGCYPVAVVILHVNKI